MASFRVWDTMVEAQKLRRVAYARSPEGRWVRPVLDDDIDVIQFPLDALGQLVQGFRHQSLEGLWVHDALLYHSLTIWHQCLGPLGAFQSWGDLVSTRPARPLSDRGSVHGRCGLHYQAPWGIIDAMEEQASLSQILLSEGGRVLREAMEAVHLTDGEVLFHRDELGDALYVVEFGRVRVFTLDETGRELTLNVMEPGEAFGEMALLDSRPRSASVAAIGSTTLRCLHREDFLAQVHTSPELTKTVVRLISERARHMTEYIELMGRWARMVAEGRYDEAMRNIRDRAEVPDRTVAAVADAIGDMVRAVREREEQLQKEVAQLRIRIDQTKREKQVAEITETDYFQKLAQQAESLRKQSDD